MTAETTPDRILAAALRLFNLRGVDRVPVYKIAAEIGISPGNVTYHFARKQDIIYRLIDDLEAEASEVLASPRNPSAKQVAIYVVNLFRLMWRYHFFFESLSYLTTTDPQVGERYQRIMKTAIKWSVQRIEDAAASGDIPPILAPSSPQILGENMWAIWVNRLAIARPGADSSDGGKSAIYDCCLHHLSLIQPYATVRYISRLHEEILELLEFDSRAIVV